MNRDRIDFGKEKIGPLFKAIFIPTLIGMIFNTALTIIDGIFVGQGVGADGIAAVNIVAPVFMVCTGIGLMLGIGSSVVASIRLASDNVKGARIIITQAFIVGTIVLGAICLAFLLFPQRSSLCVGVQSASGGLRNGLSALAASGTRVSLFRMRRHDAHQA